MEFKNFSDFWPYYLKEHSRPMNRRLHFLGTLLVHLLIIYALVAKDYFIFIELPVLGYGLAWAGHYVIEKNRPATFEHPLWSLRGDLKLFYLMLIGKFWT